MSGERKIPSRCPCCGANLSFSEMMAFIDRCQKRGRDPIAVAYENPKLLGTLCDSCFTRGVVELVEDGDARAKHAANLARLNARGMRVVEGGRGKEQA